MKFNKQINLLVIEDESFDLNRIRRTLEPFSDQVIIQDYVADGRSALNLLREKSNDYDVIIMDYQIMGPITGERLIKEIKKIDSFIQIIVITKMTINITDFDFANRLIEAGAMWFCTKYPSDIKEYIYQPTDLLLSILNANEKKYLESGKSKSNKQLKHSVTAILDKKEIIGESVPIKELRRKIEFAAQQDAIVLITGASGTGKELVASHIHYRSSRCFEKLITVNAGSIPEELIESELFGFAKGSFTGAATPKKGLFEIADEGTIFLDEISELPLRSQVKLLRVLQEGELDKIGRTDKVKVNVRIMAATNIDLEKAVAEKLFRQDLFYRLNVLNIYVPSLRERIEDIPLLATHFIKYYSKQMDVVTSEIDAEAIGLLQSYDWPGNIRQFQNVIQRILISSADVITKKEVSDVLRANKLGKIDGPEFWFGGEILEWKHMEELFRARYFNHVKSKFKSESKAARSLGIAPSNFYRMCNKLGIR